MFHGLRVAMAMLFSVYVSSPVIAQQAAPAITAAAAGANVRFISTGSICQIRVQILSPAGDPIFDSAWKDGNVLDWPGESAGQPLTSGSYRCRVMVKDLDGHVSEKEATIVAEGGRVSIDGSEENSPRVTLLVHDGSHGSIVSNGGDLSFRFGNFLAGKDSEAMRLTADGDLRVDGVIHASKGILFADGTLLTSAAGLPGVGETGGIPRREPASPSPDGAPPMSYATAPRLLLLPDRPPVAAAKRPAPTGIGGPSPQFVVNSTGVAIGTTNPAYRLDVYGPINTASRYDIAGSWFVHNYGVENAFFGQNAGNFTMTGNDNTASGFTALQMNTTGVQNTASGADALSLNTTGDNNTANGALALLSNVSGSSNTAGGALSLRFNVGGSWNTATGYAALYHNNASYNTANGYEALLNNSSGAYNTATGYQALFTNTGGGLNTANGYNALFSNTVGVQNTAVGYQALLSCTGSGNIAIGDNAGGNPTTGNSNIEIGNSGVAADAKVIRLGAVQTKTFIAGIRDVTTGGAAIPVLIDANGQLGTVSSSRRYKFDINGMGETTEDLMRLRPVTFRYLAHGDDAPLQYGLIAEEVAEVYPELVARNKDGEVETVMYQFLPPMLLNEMQKQHRRIDEQQAEIESQRKTIERQNAALEALERRLQSLERQAAQR